MGLPTEEQQRELLEWYEKQRGGVTTSVKKAIGAWAAEISLIAKLEAAAVDKEKFAMDAEKARMVEVRLEKMAQALNKSSSHLKNL